MSRKDKGERRGTPDGGEPRVEVPRSPLSLAMAVEQVRAELIEAQRQGEGQDLRFNVDAVELTLGIEFGSEDSSEKSVDGGVQVWVVRAGGRGTVGNRRSRRATNTVTLKLTPQRPADGNVSSGPVQISGTSDELPG
jgi:hypothetical protein